VHVTGDLRTGENFHATNASLVEHDSNARLQGYDYAELAGLVRYRHRPGNPGIAAILARDRNVRLTLDIRLQLEARGILERQLRAGRLEKGAAVVLEASTGDVLALVSAPAPDPPSTRTAAPRPDELLDRARYGQYPPGSTFKLVTAIAALRTAPALRQRSYLCRTMPGGRAGTTIHGWNRAIYDDIGDPAHGTITMEQAIAVSCNAWFAQLGVHDVGSQALAETAALVGASTGDLRELRQALPFAAYGQGPVLISPVYRSRLPRRRHAAGGHRRDRAPRHGRHCRLHRGQDRHRAARQRAAARLVRRLRPLRRRSQPPPGLRRARGTRRLRRTRRGSDRPRADGGRAEARDIAMTARGTP
jgi:hypothetical protein